MHENAPSASSFDSKKLLPSTSTKFINTSQEFTLSWYQREKSISQRIPFYSPVASSTIVTDLVNSQSTLFELNQSSSVYVSIVNTALCPVLITFQNNKNT